MSLLKSGLVLSLVSLSTLTSLPSSLQASQQMSETKKVFPLTTSLQSLEFEGAKGKLIIQVHSKNEISVTIKKVEWSKDCEESMVQFGPSMTLKFKASSLFSKAQCVVEAEISLPKSVDLDISHGSMETSLKGSFGQLKYKSASGKLLAQGEFTKVEATVASSDVFIEGLTSDTEIIGASSDVKLVYAKCPVRPSKLSISRASGDVEIFAPKACQFKTKIKTASGETFNEFGDSKNPDIDLSSVSASGDLTIKKLK